MTDTAEEANGQPETPKRASGVTVRKRVEQVLQMRLLGAEFTEIRQHAEAPGWNVSERQLWRYIAAGDDLLGKALEKDRQKLLTRHLAQRQALCARCIASEDYATATRVLKDLAEPGYCLVSASMSTEVGGVRKCLLTTAPRGR
jgi:hypothetical protein